MERLGCGRADWLRRRLACRLDPLAYTAMATLLVELVGLFAGATIFNRGLTCLYILLHFIGAILTGLFVEQVSHPSAQPAHPRMPWPRHAMGMAPVMASPSVQQKGIASSSSALKPSIAYHTLSCVNITSIMIA